MTMPSNFDRILIAIDDSQPAKWAVQVGRQLACQLKAHVMLMHVVQPTVVAAGDDFAMDKQAEVINLQYGKELLERNSALFALPVIVETSLSNGCPAEQIAGEARCWKADLIVIGTHSRCRLAQFVLGSTAGAVIRQSPCPVITVAHAPRPGSAKMNERLGAGIDSPARVAPINGARTCDWIDGELPNQKHSEVL